jgi:hypothetical protein
VKEESLRSSLKKVKKVKSKRKIWGDNMNKTITEMSIESRLTTTMLLVHKDKSAQENKSEAPEMRDDSEC